VFKLKLRRQMCSEVLAVFFIAVQYGLGNHKRWYPFATARSENNE
jgi:hypothetical protein